MIEWTNQIVAFLSSDITMEKGHTGGLSDTPLYMLYITPQASRGKTMHADIRKLVQPKKNRQCKKLATLKGYIKYWIVNVKKNYYSF